MGSEAQVDDGRKNAFGRFVLRWLFSTNHIDVGTRYLIFAICAGIVGGALSVVMRMELQAPGLQYFADARMFDVIVTAHGLVMVFFMVMPAMIGGFGNWLVPLQIGARDVAFPRLNVISFWLLPVAFVMLLASMFVPGSVGGFGFSGEGTVYPSVSNGLQPGLAADFAIVAVLLAGVSALLGAINFITTIFNMRAPGMTLHKMPLFVWSILISAFLLLLSLPVFAGAITMLFADRNFGTAFYALSEGGAPDLYQNLFWFFANPEVYILILPGFGIVSHIVSTFSARPVVGYHATVYAMLGFGLVGFIVWSQQMYAGGRSVDARAYFVFATMVIAVPTTVLVYSWIATMRRGVVSMRLPMLWALGFIFLFTVGGATGVTLAFAGVNSGIDGTYYVVGHFHYVLFQYVLSLSVVFSIFAAWYYWFPKMTGKMHSEFWGKLHFWLTLIGASLLLFPQNFLGGPGMVRGEVNSPAGDTVWSSVSSLGAYIAALGTVCFVIGLVVALRGKKTVGENPWGKGAVSLEWSMSSPPVSVVR